MTTIGSARTTALVPLRGDGKSRLGAALGPRGRAGLVAAMLDDVLAALVGGGVEDIRVLAGDVRAAGLARARGLPVVTDPDVVHESAATGDHRLRVAVDAGLAAVPVDHARLIVAADLPRLTAAEVAATLAGTASVVVVPTVGGGTALLRLAPRVVIASRYGAGSAGEHLRAAEEAGYAAAVLDLPGARYDVDAATDLDALSHPLDGATTGPATAAFVAQVAG